MPQSQSPLAMVGNPIGSIIVRSSPDSEFEGNIVFSNEYDELGWFDKLELLNDIVSVCRNEYEYVQNVRADLKANGLD